MTCKQYHAKCNIKNRFKETNEDDRIHSLKAKLSPRETIGEASTATTTGEAPARLEEELLTLEALLEWIPTSRIVRVVGIVAVVEPRAQLWVAEDFVCFVDSGHLRF